MSKTQTAPNGGQSMADTTSRTLRQSVKFTECQSEQAKAYRDGVNFALNHTTTSGDDDHWTELEYRNDGNGNPSWYVELHSCPPDWPESPWHATPQIKKVCAQCKKLLEDSDMDFCCNSCEEAYNWSPQYYHPYKE